MGNKKIPLSSLSRLQHTAKGLFTYSALNNIKKKNQGLGDGSQSQLSGKSACHAGMRTRIQISRNPNWCRVRAAARLEFQPWEEELFPRSGPGKPNPQAQSLMERACFRDWGGRVKMIPDVSLWPAGACVDVCAHTWKKYAHTHVYIIHIRKREKKNNQNRTKLASSL